MSSLGKLLQVDLRDTWETEDRHFTPWLANDENLKTLSETIGIELELEAQEKDVGPFRADILCKSTEDDTWVLIENQIERTDHKHLGQLLTYAAGLEAVTIVWIAAKFEDQHRKAIDWLNDITDEKFKFFALEVELWRIDDSLPAPKFNIVSKPNNWGKRVKRAAQDIEDSANTPTQILRVKYWSNLHDFLSKDKSGVQLRHGKPINWQDFALGKANAFMRLSMNVQEGFLAIGLHLQKQMSPLYYDFVKNKSKIESELGFELEWRIEPYPILSVKLECDPSLESDWEHQSQWIKNTLEKMRLVFMPKLRAYTPSSDAEGDMVI